MSNGRILAKIARDEFVGRDEELHQLTEYAAQPDSRRALVLAAPNAGASEFLRQAYDELFFRREAAVPIHFAFDRKSRTRSEIAGQFFRSFLQQYIAYRRVDPALCVAQTSFYELADLALPTDYEAVSSLIEAFERERATADERSFLRFCLAAPEKLAREAKRGLLPLLDCVALSSDNDES